MKTFMLMIPSLLPVVALADAAQDEPSMWEAVVPFAVIAVMLAILGPLVARKKK